MRKILLCKQWLHNVPNNLVDGAINQLPEFERTRSNKLSALLLNVLVDDFVTKVPYECKCITKNDLLSFPSM